MKNLLFRMVSASLIALTVLPWSCTLQDHTIPPCSAATITRCTQGWVLTAENISGFPRNPNFSDPCLTRLFFFADGTFKIGASTATCPNAGPGTTGRWTLEGCKLTLSPGVVLFSGSPSDVPYDLLNSTTNTITLSQNLGQKPFGGTLRINFDYTCQ